MKKHKRNALSIVLYLITFKWLFVGLIYFYKFCISPLLPDTCIYYPSCSTYMLEAIHKFGVVRGIIMGTRRLLRCVPWKKGGFDPVPDNPHGDMKWLF